MFRRARRRWRRRVREGGRPSGFFRLTNLFSGSRFVRRWRGSLVDRRREGRGRVAGWRLWSKEILRAGAGWTGWDRGSLPGAGEWAGRRGVVWRLVARFGRRAFALGWRPGRRLAASRAAFRDRRLAG